MSEVMRPPINRAMRVLDRNYFKKSIPLAAARVFKNQHISQCRQELEKSKDILRLERGVISIRPDPVAEYADVGKKCVLLQEHIKPNGTALAITIWDRHSLTLAGRLHDLEFYITVLNQR